MDLSAMRLRALLSASGSAGSSTVRLDAPAGAVLRVDMRGPALMSGHGRSPADVTFSHLGVVPDPTPDDVEVGAPRDVSGLAVPWRTVVHRFGVPVQFTPETLRIPDPSDAVKLLVQHDDERPIGSLAAASSESDGLRTRFDVPPGIARAADAMADLDARLREGLSIGVELDAETIDAIWERLFMGAPDDAQPIDMAGVLREVSLVAVPQFLAARVDAESRTLVTFERSTPAMTVPTTRAASTLAPHDSGAPDRSSTPGPAHPTTTDTAGHASGSAMSLEELAAQLAPLLSLSGGAPRHPLARFGSLDAYLTAAHETGVRHDDGTRVVLALADQITANNPGVLPPTWLQDVAGIIDRGRPAITAFGALGAGETGMTINWPYYDGDPSVLVGEQVAQKTEVTTGRVDIKSGNAALKTYAGASDISYQLLKRSSPSYRELYARILAIAFAIRTDIVFCADLIAGGTVGPTWDGVTVESLTAALFDASAAVDDALGSPASIVIAAPDVFRTIGNLPGLIPPAYGTQNVPGTAQASTLTVAVSGLTITKDRNMPAGGMIVSGDGAAAWREDGPYPIEAEDVAVLGRDVGIWGMGVTTITVPAAVVSVTDTIVARESSTSHGKSKS